MTIYTLPWNEYHQISEQNCADDEFLGDLYCDDYLNNEECHFDNGDCCIGGDSNFYCKECKCIEG